MFAHDGISDARKAKKHTQRDSTGGSTNLTRRRMLKRS